MHLAVDAAQYAVRIENRSRIVIETRCTLLEERCDQHDFILEGGGGELLRAWAGDRLREIEQGGVFALAEILRLEELRQADNVGAFARRLRNPVKRLGQIVGRLGASRHLNQSDGELVSHVFSQVRVILQSLRFCHPERSEGSVCCGELQIPRSAPNDNS